MRVSLRTGCWNASQDRLPDFFYTVTCYPERSICGKAVDTFFLANLQARSKSLKVDSDIPVQVLNSNGQVVCAYRAGKRVQL